MNDYSNIPVKRAVSSTTRNSFIAEPCVLWSLTYTNGNPLHRCMACIEIITAVSIVLHAPLSKLQENEWDIGYSARHEPTLQ